MEEAGGKAVRAAHRVIQAFDVENHGFGTFVAAPQEELGLSAAGYSLIRLVLRTAGSLQDLVDLRGQQLGLPRCSCPSQEKKKKVP